MSVNKKVSRKILKYILLGMLFLSAGIIMYVALMDDTDRVKREQEALEVKRSQIEQAESVTTTNLEQVLIQQEIEAREQLTPPVPPPQRHESISSGPDQDDSVSMTAPLPGMPRRESVVNDVEVFRRNHQEVVVATSMPEIFDVTGQTGAVQQQAAGDNPTTDDNSGGVQGDAHPLDSDSWQAPYSAVTTPQRAPSKYLLQAGSVVDVVLLNEVNTQLPGKVQFRVVSNVYDSLGGRHLLIPQGTKLLGAYGKPPNYGLDLVPISVQRALFADGRSILLQDTEISDAMGNVGAPADFHSNIWRALGPAALVAWIGYKADESLAGQVQTGAQTNGSTLQQSISQETIPEIQNRILERYGTAEPYYTIPAGKRLSLVIASDIAIPIDAN
jgi:type IV secretory pathway VirB10-like protein